MSNKKTISIDKSLFVVGRNKTKKNREKTSKPANVPIISPNVLKNKLLKRIKEHKQKETQNVDGKKRTEINIKDGLKESENHTEQTSFSDEFNDSIHYLQSLTKQKKMNEEKELYEMQKERRRAELERKTIKNHHSLASSYTTNPQASSMPIVNIDLPTELQQIEPVIRPYTDPSKVHSYSGIDTVPYGILKNGTKPTFRQWNKTQKNNVVIDPNASLVINNGITARENRLNMLKEKIKRKNAETKMDPMLSENMIKKNAEAIRPVQNQSASVQLTHMPSVAALINNQTASHTTQNPNPNPNPHPHSENTQENGEVIATKHITKKTIKRKYSLGRSNIKRKVAVLIKDKGTRKKIISAQKDLKRKNINEVKEYLRKHNLWALGSNAPNDVLRQMYESAMLSGEITNSNSETLLQNLTKEDKEL